jgi:Asp/Glu/hydantoin racemase
LAALRSAVEQAVERYAARTVIIGGAGLAGLAARLQPDTPVPLIDSVLAGARLAGALAREHASAAAPPAGTRTPGDRIATTGLGQELGRLLS